MALARSSPHSCRRDFTSPAWSNTTVSRGMHLEMRWRMSAEGSTGSVQNLCASRRRTRCRPSGTSKNQKIHRRGGELKRSQKAMRRRIPKDEYAPPLRLRRHCANRVHDAIEWVRATVETYEKPG